MNGTTKKTKTFQSILVFQQNKSGERKIAGIEKFGRGMFDLKRISIDTPLPPVIDDTRQFLPDEIKADLILDFLEHPDLSYDLALLCEKTNIPIVASGKKTEVKSVLTPPT